MIHAAEIQWFFLDEREAQIMCSSCYEGKLFVVGGDNYSSTTHYYRCDECHECSFKMCLHMIMGLHMYLGLNLRG